MLSLPLVAWCVGAGSAYLLISQLVLDWVERVLIRHGLYGNYSVNNIELPTVGRSISEFFTQVGVFVLLPTMIFSFLYTMIPFEGPRAGVVIAIGATVIGAAPALISANLRLKLPTPALVFVTIGQFVKLAGILGIIGYLFSL